MLCPHCATAVKYDWYTTSIFEVDEEKKEGVCIKYAECPNCFRLAAYIQKGLIYRDQHCLEINEVEWEKLIYPKQKLTEDLSDIPKVYLEDYEEAVKVLSVSPKASAALSRRILQNILREEFNIKEKNLALEIESFINLKGIPSHLTDAVDAIRNIGNLAAHPIKNNNTGEIVPVENGEAEWLIEVIEALFDFAFIQPTKLERRRKELNLKLNGIGKPELKKKKAG